MSVIVKRLKSNSMEIYVKGAPEVMLEICDKSSCKCDCLCHDHAAHFCICFAVPQDYDDLLSYYTKRGYRVIAIAGKSIEGLSWLKAQRMKRFVFPHSAQICSGSLFRFQGASGIWSQVSGPRHIRKSTQAGDDACYTSITICSSGLQNDYRRQSTYCCQCRKGMQPHRAGRPCFLTHFCARSVLHNILYWVKVYAQAATAGNASTPASKLVWSSMDDPAWKLEPYSLKPMSPPPHHAVEVDELTYQDYSLVVTGDVFRWMINYSPLETLQRVRQANGCPVELLIKGVDAGQDTDICQDVSRRKE